jgi:hypothetical protein
LPPIAAPLQRERESFPGERTVAILSGVTDRSSARDSGAHRFSGFSFSLHHKEGRRSKRLPFNSRANRKDRYFSSIMSYWGRNWHNTARIPGPYPSWDIWHFDPVVLEVEKSETTEVPFDQEEFRDLYRKRDGMFVGQS